MNINSTTPPNHRYRFEYTYNHCYYSLDSKESQIHIEMQDFTQKRTTSVLINAAMLDLHHPTMKDLRDQIYKQSIHEGSSKKYILTHEDDNIIISFTYPKCTMKKLRFKCQWKDMERSIIKAEQIYRKMEKMFEENQKRHKTFFAKFQESMNIKLQKCISVLQAKYKGLCSKLGEQALNMIDQQIELLRSQCQQSMKKERQILNDSNHRYFDEFRLIETSLQDDLAKCDFRINEIINDVNKLKILRKAENDETLRQMNIQQESQNIQEERSEHQDEQMSFSAQQPTLSSQNSMIDQEHTYGSQLILNCHSESQNLPDVATIG